MSEGELKNLKADADQETNASSEISGEEISDEELAGVAGGCGQVNPLGPRLQNDYGQYFI
jgi:hypothetical protein